MDPSSTSHSPHWRSAPKSVAKPSLRDDLAGLFWAVCAVLHWLSLQSYNPIDPSLNTSRNLSEPIRNHVGMIGAYSSDFFLQLFGVASYSLSFLMLLTAIQRFRHRKSSSWWYRSILSIVWIMLLASLLHWNRNSVQLISGKTFPSGGFVGMLLAEQFYFWLGREGGRIALITLFTFFTLQVFQVSAKHILKTLTRGLASFLPAATRTTLTFARTNIMRLFKVLTAFIQQLFRRTWNLFWKKKPTAEVTITEPLAPVAAPSMLRSVPTQPRAPLKTSLIDVTPEEGPILSEAPGSMRPQTEKRGATHHEAAPAPFVDDLKYEHPSYDFLESTLIQRDSNLRHESFKDNAKRLTQKLAAFGVHGTVETICPGPVITMYEFKPKEEVKVSKIANLSDDLSLALSAESVRIIAPIPGKPVVGIEIPNEDPEPVTLKEILAHSSFQNANHRIPIAFGKDIAGQPFVADLTQMPHLLVAGSTGSGKSVFINTVICSMLYRFTPSQIRMILIDPKMVELSVYDHIPHLLLPVVTDAQKASLALQWAVDEMERRYELLHDLQVRNIESYNLKVQQGFEPTPSGLTHQHLPLIVIVVDELADLMMMSPKDVEISIARLAQKARAAGIHLILATQRPDTTVITGTIKANFSSRIAFRVSSRIDSSTILDDKGAEKLLGRGDMLIRITGVPRITRMHGAYVSEQEVERIVSHVRSQGEPTYDETILLPREEEAAAIDAEEMDEVYDRALDVVSRERVASISLVQRRLRIGYNRAARIIETMERQGIIGPSDGTSRPRRVLAPPPPD